MAEQEATGLVTTPETLVINGVIYRRESDWVEKRINEINDLLTIVQRTHVPLRQVYFIIHGVALPD
jgi:flagellar biosynthesis regulator FlbT